MAPAVVSADRARDALRDFAIPPPVRVLSHRAQRAVRTLERCRGRARTRAWDRVRDELDPTRHQNRADWARHNVDRRRAVCRRYNARHRERRREQWRRCAQKRRRGGA